MSLITIGLLIQKAPVMPLLLDSPMEASEFITKQENYKKLFKMHILNLSSVLNGAMMEELLLQLVKMVALKFGQEMEV